MTWLLHLSHESTLEQTTELEVIKRSPALSHVKHKNDKNDKNDKDDKHHPSLTLSVAPASNRMFIHSNLAKKHFQFIAGPGEQIPE